MTKRRGFADFNRDGKVSLGERWIEYQIYKDVMGVDDSKDNWGSSNQSSWFSAFEDEDEDDWRETCEDGLDYDLDPEDFETEEEYEEALEEAKEEQLYTISDKGVSPVKGRSKPKKVRLSKVLKEKEQKQPFQRKYMSDGGIRFVQAAVDHFTLPCTFPRENDCPQTTPSDFMKRMLRRDPKLAIRVWDWWLKYFCPYLKNEFDRAVIHNSIILGEFYYSDAYWDNLLEYMAGNQAFTVNLIQRNPEVPACIDTLIYEAIRVGEKDLALSLFSFCLKNSKVKAADIESMMDECLSKCRNHEEVETMECFRDVLYAHLKEVADKEVSALFPEWDREIVEYINDMEIHSDRYAYSRRNAWRNQYKDEWGDYFNLGHYETEAEFLEALEEHKYQWRTWRKWEAAQYKLTLTDYETEQEFAEAVRAKQNAEYQERAAKAREESEARHREREAQRQKDNLQTEQVLQDKTVYVYCGVMFQSSTRVYNYRCDDIDIEIGDQVVVPMGRNQKETTATVVSVSRHLRIAVPYPVEHTKAVIRKVDTSE